MSADARIATPAEFESALLAFGADLSRWPTARRTEAAALLAASDEARGLLAEAERVEEMAMAALAVEVPPGVLAARVMAGLARRREGFDPRQFFTPARLALGGGLAALCGVALGLAFPIHDSLSPDVLLAAAFGGGLL